MTTHETYMGRCLELADLGSGLVAPNPMVGAVLVHNNRIIGEGFHERFGHAHAEVNCINSVLPVEQHLLKLSTLYVSLEPCSHFGKTPPCADLIIKTQIPKVVIACKDPFSEVNGGGIKKLAGAGVEIIFGVLERQAIELNKRFFTFHIKNRPYIILKWAQSADRKIAGSDNQPVKISNTITDTLVHKWRSEEAAIMIGFNTAKFDDPSLSNRHWLGRNPLRIVFDPILALSNSLKMLSDSAPTLILNYKEGKAAGAKSYLRIEENENLVTEINRALFACKVSSVIIEGGAKLLNAFLQSGCWDEVRIIQNHNLIIEEGLDAPVFSGSLAFYTTRFYDDEVTFYENPDNRV